MCNSGGGLGPYVVPALGAVQMNTSPGRCSTPSPYKMKKSERERERERFSVNETFWKRRLKMFPYQIIPSFSLHPCKTNEACEANPPRTSLPQPTWPPYSVLSLPLCVCAGVWSRSPDFLFLFFFAFRSSLSTFERRASCYNAAGRSSASLTEDTDQGLCQGLCLSVYLSLTFYLCVS